jgi:iron complex transport system ATP-binding protein
MRSHAAGYPDDDIRSLPAFSSVFTRDGLTMIEAKDIHFCHQGATEAVLNGVCLTARPGELTTILGPNGCGKTTLFKCITGLWRPQKGAILFENTSILDCGHEKRARLIAMVPQDHEPPFPYSVFDAVLMGRAVHIGMFSIPAKKDREAAESAIAEVGIEHLKTRIYTKISGGERQMALVARAMAQNAPAMLFDEPTSHLDFRNQVLVLKKIKEIIARRQVTALMTIHDPNAALLFSDSVVLLGRGGVVAQGPPAEVITAENLQAVYGLEVSIGLVNGAMVVTPRLGTTSQDSNAHRHVDGQLRIHPPLKRFD